MTYVKKDTLPLSGNNNAEFGVSSMISNLKTVGMLKPMEALRTADPTRWHYGQYFDPTKIDSNYLSFKEVLAKLDVKILWMTPKNNNIADAKIAGITPAEFNFNGKCEESPPYILFPICLLG